MTLVADPVLAERFGMGSVGFGMISAAIGGGTILGSMIGRRIAEVDEGKRLILCSGALALTTLAVVASPWFWLVIVWIGLFGLADGPTQVVEQNLLQRRTPDVVRSRVVGAWETLFHTGLLIALVLGGVIVPIVGPEGAYAIGGATGLIGTLVLLPLLRWLPERDAAAAPAERAPDADRVG